MSLRAWIKAGQKWDNIADATEEAMREALEDIGINFHAMLIKKLSQPGSGKTYKRGSVQHTASAPGEPPAVDTGQYRSSWEWKVLTEEKAVDVFTDQARAPALEFGSKNIAPRPHVRPVVEEFRGSIPELLAKRIVAQQAQAMGANVLIDVLV